MGSVHENILDTSEIIKSSNIELEHIFANTDVHSSKEKFVRDICIQCSKYYSISERNEVINRVDTINNNNNLEAYQNELQDINAWSADNLMATYIFIHFPETRKMVKEYKCFVDTLTLAEIMVCSPILLSMTILRSRASLLCLLCNKGR